MHHFTVYECFERNGLLMIVRPKSNVSVEAFILSIGLKQDELRGVLQPGKQTVFTVK
jgi:hypothetical protein